MLNELFEALIQLYLMLFLPFLLIDIWAEIWFCDDVTLGCPVPELHDRNNENFEVLVTGLDGRS